MTTRADPVTISLRPVMRLSFRAGTSGLIVLLVVGALCFITLPWSLSRYDLQRLDADTSLTAPSLAEPMGTDLLGRSVLWRCMLGGAISLSIGVCAAVISVAVGVLWGMIAGYTGGRTDAIMMRVVDVLYGLPYVLLVVLLDIALQPVIESAAYRLLPDSLAPGIAQVATLLLAIGGVSWLTMARVIRGQVLSLRNQPFIEAARAYGVGPGRILRRHILPNLVGPIIVYATLTVPAAILQESFLSFLGIGVQPPLPSWGSLAADGLGELHALGQTGIDVRWWLLAWPCILLAMTLLALNLLGDDLRDRLDPRHAR